MRNRPPRPTPTAPGIDPANEIITQQVLAGYLVDHRLGNDPRVHQAAEQLAGVLQVASTDTLRLLALHGMGLIEALVRADLAGRGYDKAGQWVGFERSASTWSR